MYYLIALNLCLLSVLGGKWYGHLLTPRPPSPPPPVVRAAPVPLPIVIPRPAPPPPPPGPPSTCATLLASIAWEESLWQLAPSAFPTLFTQEMAQARNRERPLRLLAVWAERDEAGHLAWLKSQPPSIALPEVPGSVDLRQGLLGCVQASSPEHAWTLAAEFPAEMEALRWRVLARFLEGEFSLTKPFVLAHLADINTMKNGDLGTTVDPLRATDLALLIPAGEVRNHVLNALHVFYVEHPEEIRGAEDWFNSLPAQNQLLVDRLAQTSPTMKATTTAHRQQLQKLWHYAP